MRYDCDLPGHESNFVEVADSWSRAEMRRFRQLFGSESEADNDEYLALIRSKTVALRLSCVGADDIADPCELTDDRLDDIDQTVYLWFASVHPVAVREINRLGEASVRRLWQPAEGSAAPTLPTPS